MNVMTAASTTAPSPATFARLPRIVFAVDIVTTFTDRDRRCLARLVARSALDQFEQQHRIIDHLAAPGELGLAALLAGGLELALRDQEVAEALAIAPGDVELCDHRMRELVNGPVEIASAELLWEKRCEQGTERDRIRGIAAFGDRLVDPLQRGPGDLTSLGKLGSRGEE